MYIKQIEQLVVLQKVDNEIYELEEKQASVPKYLGELQEKIKSVQVHYDQVQEKIDILNTQHKKLETEIENDSQKVQKSKNKLMLVENTKEYHAMMREMDTLEKMNRLREEEKVALLEDLQQQKELQETVYEELKGLEQKIEDNQSSLDEELSSINKRLKKLRQKSNEACKAIPEKVLERYEFIKNRLAPPVIASVTAGICNGCHIKIPPQTYIEVQKGEFISSCPNCQRIIYWENHFLSPEDQEPQKDK